MILSLLKKSQISGFPISNQFCPMIPGYGKASQILNASEYTRREIISECCIKLNLIVIWHRLVPNQPQKGNYNQNLV